MAEEVRAVEQNAENNDRKLRKKDLWHCFLLWESTSESCLSYERLMSLGFCHAMTPIINRLYKTKEERAAALKRHMVFSIQRITGERLYRESFVRWKKRKRTGMKILPMKRSTV